jgi:hypothetical protein
MRCIGPEKCYLQANVPVDTAKNVRNWSVRPRNAGYRLDAARTPNVPTPRPARPPMMPPLTVTLGDLLVLRVPLPQSLTRASEEP